MANERDILLVGSIPLRDEATVFEALGRHLGAAAPRYPDGETGDRAGWVLWQAKAFRANPLFERTMVSASGRDWEKFPIKAGVDDAALSFDTLGYAEAAIASWETFESLRRDGVIPAGTRFQVSLPTPVAIAQTFADRNQVPPVTAAIARRLDVELAEIFAAIPHQDLAIQWDCAIEPVVIAGGMPDLVGGMRDHFLASVPALIDRVPARAEVGVHFCYGDPGHKHIIEPVDLGICVDLANETVRRAGRPIDWIHMPVPRERDDDAYFAPLADLELPEATRLYLGLVHLTDGVEGTKRRIAAASRYQADFGIGTECGLGRRAPETVPALLDIHVAALA